MNSMRVTFPTDNSIVLLGKVTENRSINTCIFMIPINPKQEEDLSLTESFVYQDGYDNIIVSPKDIYLIGNLDMTDENDISFLRQPGIKWCNDTHHGSFIPRDYDYETNTGLAINKKPAYVETFDNLKMFLFGHASLGYPKKVCVFKRNIKNKYICN